MCVCVCVCVYIYYSHLYLYLRVTGSPFLRKELACCTTHPQLASTFIKQLPEIIRRRKMKWSSCRTLIKVCRPENGQYRFTGFSKYLSNTLLHIFTSSWRGFNGSAWINRVKIPHTERALQTDRVWICPAEVLPSRCLIRTITDIMGRRESTSNGDHLAHLT